MLAHESTYLLGVPGGNAEVSLSGLRAILGQVEAELYHSETYEQVLSNLNNLPDELRKQVQWMVRAVGREAIRLALRKLVRKKKPTTLHDATAAVDDTTMPLEAASLHAEQAPANLNPTLTEPNATIASTVVTPITVPVAARPADRYTPDRASMVVPSAQPSKAVQKPNRRLSKREMAAQAALKAREDCLRELGQVIQQTRQAKGWSPYHLHIRTQIPMHQLEALETGRVDRLPEDIYLRGFIRQVGNALGLDGLQMAHSLPAIDPVKAVLPSWQKPKVANGIHLNSAHIYLGYAAVMAGGIAWVSHQSAPKAAVPLLSPTITVTPPQHSPQPQNQDAKPQNHIAPFGKSGTATQANISPPETNPF